MGISRVTIWVMGNINYLLRPSDPPSRVVLLGSGILALKRCVIAKIPLGFQVRVRVYGYNPATLDIPWPMLNPDVDFTSVT